MKPFLELAYFASFWLWNLTFLSVVYVGILPFIFIPLVQAVFSGEIQSEFLISALGIILTPTICTLIGAIKFRRQPLELLRLFYGVEAPLFLLFLVRSFVLRELTPASHLVLGTVLVCVAAFAVELLVGYLGVFPKNREIVYFPAWEPTSVTGRKAQRFLPWVQVALHVLMLVVGLYVGAVLLFYALPVAAWFLKAFFSFQWLSGFWWQLTHYFFSALWFIPTFAIFFAISITLFVGMPSMLAGLYVHSGQRILRAFGAQYGRMRALQMLLGVLTAWTALYIAFQNQPQTQVFKLLEPPPQTDAQRQTLLTKSEDIRSGLLNAYLSPYRYLGTWKESNQIRVMYRSIFGFPEPMVQGIQNAYNTLASPFLYQGDRADDKKASQLYEQFFDTPIQKGERKSILRALKSTVILDDAKAGVLNIGQQKVWLAKQAVSVKERGDYAEVELHEVYNNQTFDVEEIFYSFSLPESAVLTGVWLGDSADLSKRFPFQVSPRGAAQKVYNSQVNRPRPVDPALLEQVGPRQYRLRAFPVPAKLAAWERDRMRRGEAVTRPTEMHLWMTYQVMRDEKGWALPDLAEQRNIFWTDRTERLRNGKAVRGFDKDWLEAFLPAAGSAPKQVQQVTLNGYRVAAKGLNESERVTPENKRLAIVLDTSYSMSRQGAALQKTLDWLKQQGFADNNPTNNDADLYLTTATGGQPQRLDHLQSFEPRKLTFYGTLPLKEMLRQFASLQGSTTYDGIFLITDEGSYELSKDKGEVPVPTAPLWVVHLDNLAPAYDDGMLKAIQDSNGGAATDLAAVLERLAIAEKLQKSAIAKLPIFVADGYVWQVEKLASGGDSTQDKQNVKVKPVSFEISQTPAGEDFAPLAARVLVRALSRETDGKQVKALDAIHAIAKTQGIVTPYSSMIVLVNDEQRKLLAEAEASSDRFERKVEDGKEQLNKPNNPLNAASVPEPGAIVGLSAIALLLVATYKRNPSHKR
ncbi:TIGR02921 family PEP-CTERM protein [Oscillatoria sp. FACHB-1406]|uniref:TIGR02921 family PEP-CTERM protein n=1 Tax=Oscillatoria sp. FACHB-1406 TaxID=2692846 RepID=UPI00168449C7|nr:TIGR02921 family PEP-CTERM protein [Oscillatoria sp. FACHB-1406]MBD2580480.1 TIGR02921 family PEP-CTERM protein [Oscillatoria sp. FACHB-1406]